jgi:hypothetical protein
MIPYAKNSDTSQEAAGRIRGRAPELRGRVFRCILDARLDGRTCDEIEVLLNMPHQTASARVNELMVGTMIVDSGRRRLTRSKRKATVWVAAGVIPPGTQLKLSVIDGGK